jgi:pyridoxal phosphate enzyme (YggS family)
VRAALTAEQVADNVRRVRERVAAAALRAGRRPEEIALVAAAKTKGAALVRAAIAAGVSDIGENYVQEAEGKRAAVDLPARWHLIGHLQRNKARRAVQVFDVVQTVDSYELAASLARHCAAAGRRLAVLIEVKLAAEATKNGVEPDAVAELVARLNGLHELSVDGLMAIPPAAPAGEARSYFRRLRTLAEGAGLAQLSMGMSDDFEVAVEEGATMVRVGRGIFGERL